jgi:hypothetical protein
MDVEQRPVVDQMSKPQSMFASGILRFSSLQRKAFARLVVAKAGEESKERRGEGG